MKLNSELGIECHKVNIHHLISAPDEVYPDELYKCTHYEDQFQIQALVKTLKKFIKHSGIVGIAHVLYLVQCR